MYSIKNGCLLARAKRERDARMCMLLKRRLRLRRRLVAFGGGRERVSGTWCAFERRGRVLHGGRTRDARKRSQTSTTNAQATTNNTHTHRNTGERSETQTDGRTSLRLRPPMLNATTTTAAAVGRAAYNSHSYIPSWFSIATLH